MICFDIDNTLLNFSKAFKEYMHNEHNIDINEDPETWDFGLEKKSKGKYITGFFDSKYSKMLPVMDPLIPTFLKLLPVEFDLVTMFPEKYKGKRELNLISAKISYDRIIYPKDKFEFLLANKNRYDIIVDDKPTLIDQLVESEISALICMPIWNYNKKQASYKKVKPYRDFVSLVRIIREYYKQV